MALSAVIGRLIGLVGSPISIMTTCDVSPTFSRTQMNLSLSIVSVANEMFATLMPILVSWRLIIKKKVVIVDLTVVGFLFCW